MAYDAVKMKEWQIAEDAKRKCDADEWRQKLGLSKDEILPTAGLPSWIPEDYGPAQRPPDGKYIEVTAITPPRWARQNHHHDGNYGRPGQRGLNVGGASASPPAARR